MVKTISNSDDIIDSRDVIARIDELQDERDELAEALQNAKDAHDAALDGAPDADHDEAKTVEGREEALNDWDDENELKALKALTDEAEGYAPDWAHGATLIRKTYFVEYCEELCADIGDLPRDLPSYLVIDWDATAENLAVDYTEVDFDGVTYLIR